MEEKDMLIRSQTPEEKRENKEAGEIPYFNIKLEIPEDQLKKITDAVFEEFEVLKKEREELLLEEQWEGNEAQYDGLLKKQPRLKFNISTKQSKIKVNAIVRAMREGFLDVDPKFAITPRPEETRKNAKEVARAQADFLDYELDENIKMHHDFTQIAYSSVKHYVGVQKIIWDYERETRKREEVYEGKNEVVGVDPSTNEPIIVNDGLQRFLDAHPETFDDDGRLIKNKSIIDRLQNEKVVELVVDYKETVSNSAKICYVPIKDFYVKNTTDGNKGLCKAHLIVERQIYTWWELLDKERDDEFEDVEQLKAKDEKEKEDGEKGSNPEHGDFNVIECTTYIEMKGSPEPVKVKLWFGEESKHYLGGINYPWYGIRCDYKGYWAKRNREGFYGEGKGIMWDIKDSNIAMDTLLNLGLHGTYARNILTPIVPEGSDIEKLILDNRWTEGLPLPVSDDLEDVGKGIGFVQYPQMNSNDILGFTQFLKQQEGQITGVNDLITGQESPTDPSAPATKTIALLRQSGIDIQDYLREMEPSFSETASDLLQMYYQMSRDSRKFKVGKRANKVAGSDVFNSLTKEEMLAKTNIQARAGAYAFDKINEKNENLAMWQLMLANPLVQQRPKLLYFAFVEVMKSWSPFWKNIADSVFPSVEEFNQEQAQAAVQGVLQVAQAAQQQKETTGVAPNIDIGVLINAVTQAQQGAAGLLEQQES